VDGRNTVGPDKSLQHCCLENISLLHSRIGRRQTRFLTRTAPMNPRVGAYFWKLGTAFSRSPAIPNAGKEQDQGAACRKQDQERRWEHEPGYDGPASRQTCSKVTVGRACLRTPEASLQQCFYALRLASPGSPALRSKLCGERLGTGCRRCTVPGRSIRRCRGPRCCV